MKDIILYYGNYAILIGILLFAIGLMFTSLTGRSGAYVSNVFSGISRIFTALLRHIWNGFVAFFFFYFRTNRRSYLYMMHHLPVRNQCLRFLCTILIIIVVNAAIFFALYQLVVALL